MNALEDGGRLESRSSLRVVFSNGTGAKFFTKVEGTSSTIVTVTGVLGEAVCGGLAIYHPDAMVPSGIGAVAIFVLVAMFIRKRR